MGEVDRERAVAGELPGGRLVADVQIASNAGPAVERVCAGRLVV